MIKHDNPKNTCPVINCDPSSGIKQSPVCGLQCYYNSFSLRCSQGYYIDAVLNLKQ